MAQNRPYKWEARPGMASWPEKSDRRPQLWGCGGAALGLLLGVVLTLLALIVLAPRPAPASPIAAGASSDIGVSIDDAYLTDVVASAVKGASLPIQLSNVRAEIQPNNQVTLSGNAAGPLSTTTPLVAVAQVSAQSGQLSMNILRAYVGGLPLPSSMTRALEQPINSNLAQANQSYLPPGYVISGVSTTEHRLQMTIAKG